MKQLFSIICAAILFSGCDQIDGSGHIISEKRTTSDFNGVSVSNSIEVELRTGPSAVQVEADDNLMHFVKTDVSNGTLRIRFADDINVSNSHVKVLVTAPEFSRLSASSASEIEAMDVLSSNEKITVNASSSGKITAELNAPYVTAEGSSAGEIRLKGRTRELRANISSGADLEADGLLSENTSVEVSSGADASVHASQTIKANASSGGSIKYKGGAPENAHVSSGGSVTREN